MKSNGPALLILFATLMATAGTGISIVAFPWLALQHHEQRSTACVDTSVLAYSARAAPKLWSCPNKAAQKR